MNKIADADVVKVYQENHRNDSSDKIYPNLMLLRSLNLLRDNCSPRTLDYGCGYGANTVLLSSISKEIYYADTCPVALEKTQSKLIKNLSAVPHFKTLIEPNSNALPFDNGQFELVVCASVLSLLSSEENVRHLLTEFQRVLVEGGKIFIDINGPESEFVYYSDCVGPDTYVYRGREKTGNPIQVFCPPSVENFKQIVIDYFDIIVCGHTSHTLMNYREQEFILIGSKQGLI